MRQRLRNRKPTQLGSNPKLWDTERQRARARARACVICKQNSGGGGGGLGRAVGFSEARLTRREPEAVDGLQEAEDGRPEPGCQKVLSLRTQAALVLGHLDDQDL